LLKYFSMSFMNIIKKQRNNFQNSPFPKIAYCSSYEQYFLIMNNPEVSLEEFF